MKLIKLVFVILALLNLAGCAHPLVISPDITKIERDVDNQPRIKKNVGYFIDDKAKNHEIISPGGGGDSISYLPYRDIETAFDKMLSNVFEHVTKLNTPADADSIKKDEISLVITPVIVTNSSGDGYFTWPPTRFSVDLTSKIRDASGKLIADTRVVGEGQAVYADFFQNKGVAGIRAMEDALQKMQRALFEVKYENVTSNANSVGNAMTALPKESALDRLEKLKGLSDRGLITSEEFEKKRKEILDGM